jgi:hypothetical protein
VSFRGNDPLVINGIFESRSSQPSHRSIDITRIVEGCNNSSHFRRSSPTIVAEQLSLTSYFAATKDTFAARRSARTDHQGQVLAEFVL